MNKRACSIALALGLVVSGAIAGPATAKKKKPKPPKPAACAAVTPAEVGKDKPTVVVTDAATAEAPVVQKVSLAESVADADLFGEVPDEGPLASSHDYFNVQVDTNLPSAGLYVTFEFTEHRDYDLWAYFSDGSVAASSHGFQPLIATKGQAAPADQSNTATNHGGESTSDSENLVGIITPDCGGYTIETANWLGEGGDLEVKLWLGEGVTEAGAPE